MSKKFINYGDEHLERLFSEALIGCDKAADIYKDNNHKYDNPFLESICYYAADNPDCDLRTYANNVLEKMDLRGFILSEKDLYFTSKDETIHGK